jgi:MFS family permease
MPSSSAAASRAVTWAGWSPKWIRTDEIAARGTCASHLGLTEGPELHREGSLQSTAIPPDRVARVARAVSIEVEFDESAMTRLKSGLSLFAPFAAAYFLSYLFRVINAVLAGPLVEQFNLDAAQLGVLTSIYFLTFAAAQLPVGIAIDRFGPGRVQAVLLMIAAVGALVFATASDVTGLMIGRGLIGLGVSAALIAGLKAIADDFPRKRLPLLNGAFVAFGAIGAISATTPLNWLLAHIDWRSVFVLLSGAALLVALLFLSTVRRPRRRPTPTATASPDMRSIYANPQFWRLAPLSALCIGSAWAFQGLWAAAWLADVALIGRAAIVHHLFLMGVALCAAALLIGIVSQAVSSLGIGPAPLLRATAAIFIAAELDLVWRVALPSETICAVLAAMGGATVLSYALLTDFFPRAVLGRANAALNILHIGGAFAIQMAIGLIVGLWERDAGGHYPAQAYQTAFSIVILLQLAALLWFLRPVPLADRLGSPVTQASNRA